MDATNKKNFGDGQVPLTPPRMNDALPTPPTSHIELSNATHPPTREEGMSTLATDLHQHSHIGELSSPPESSEQLSQASPSRTNIKETESSPSITAHQRKVKRISTGTSQSSTAVDSVQDLHETGDHTEVQIERGRSRQPHQNGTAQQNHIGSPSRSRTPSPILGSALNGRDGRLSFNAALEPSPEEVRSLLYGDANEKEESRPQTISKGEVDELMLSLSSMGLDQVDEEMQFDQTSEPREKRLASMVKKLVKHVQKQDHFIDHREEVLHNTRIRSIAMLSSLRTSFAHTFVAEYELRARLEAELEGVKLQARKLSQLLAKSETRNEELDRERAMSAEEEILWQEEMKDHASAYAKQQAARARAAQLLQTQTGVPSTNSVSQQNKTTSETTKQELPSTEIGEIPLENATKEPPLAGLEEAFEERKASNGVGNLPQSVSDSSLAGLGISSGVGASVTIDGVSAPAGSPLSTIIKERNKLLADKRYLKNRVRDSEAQRDRLELELKSLRPLLVRGVPAKNTVASQLSSTPNTPSRSQKRDRSRRRRQAMMGDAEAEHLLLAARRLQSSRSGKNMDENGRPVTPPAASSTAATNPRTPRTPRITQTPRSTAAMIDSVNQSGASSRMATDSVFASNASPLAGRNGSIGRWGTHQRTESSRSIGGIDDLLQAAQTVLTPGERLRQQQELQRRQQGLHDIEQGEDVGDVTATNEVEEEDEERVTRPNELLAKLERSALQSSIDESPKRRRVSSVAIDGDRRRSSLLGSPDKSSFLASARRLRTHTEGADPHSALMPNASQNSALSALDLLADQAAASQQPSQSSEQSHSGEGENFGGGGRSDDSDDGMHVDHIGPNGVRPLNNHYYPRGAYGHPYAHPPLNHEGYRLPNQPQGYAYGPTGSPVTMSASQGWTSQTLPPGRNGIYSPPASHHTRFALQTGPRISSGYVANMQDGARMANGGNPMMHPSMMNGGGGGGGMGMGGGGGGGYSDDEGSPTQRTPQKGGNTSPDKRLPYVRWSEDEDQRLRRAIKEYGQRWESVAREVGTRTYHQCRQRYLLMRRKEAQAREGHNGSGEDIQQAA